MTGLFLILEKDREARKHSFNTSYAFEMPVLRTLLLVHLNFPHIYVPKICHTIINSKAF